MDTSKEKNSSRKFSDYYKIDKSKSLGQGQYGEVYVCNKIQNNNNYEKYCVKIIPLQDKESNNKESNNKESNNKESNDEEKINEILSKYNKSNSESNPKCSNIVQTYDTFKDETSLQIVMEQCDEDLNSQFERMKQSNTWYSEQEVFEIIRQIITAMNQLYNLKIIHRDIKPENILIKKENQTAIYKLGDFGVGKYIEDIVNKSVITKTGTLNYAAPQMIFNEYCTSKCDIYSYGILFYNICYKGEFPYPCNTKQLLLTSLKQLKSKRLKAPLLSFNRGAVLQDLLEKMIVYDEAQRTSFEEIFKHQIMAQRGMEETTMFMEPQQLCEPLPFNKKEFQEKEIKQNPMQDLQIRKTLLEVFFNRFKICCYFVKEIVRNQQHHYFSYIIYLIAKYQLEYALALVYIRPLEFHPVIKQDRDILDLVQEQREIFQLILQNEKENLTKEVLSLQKEIQAGFHKLRFRLFSLENKMIFSSELEQQEKDIVKNSVNSRIEISILQNLLKDIRNQQSATINKQLKELLDEIIDLETAYPINLYKSNTDLNEKFPIYIIQQYNKDFI